MAKTSRKFLDDDDDDNDEEEDDENDDEDAYDFNDDGQN